MNRTLTDQYFL